MYVVAAVTSNLDFQLHGKYRWLHQRTRVMKGCLTGSPIYGCGSAWNDVSSISLVVILED